MDTQTLWNHANQRLMAKIIGEAHYEGCFDVEALDEAWFHLILAGNDYSFRAQFSCWGWLRVAPDTLKRNDCPATSATQLVVDAQQSLGMNDIVLGQFLEELQNTLAGDQIQQQHLATFTAEHMLALPEPQLQSLLDGHPKALANRGRLGWSQADLHTYSPEAGRPFQLRWLAVAPSLTGTHAGTPPLDQCLSSSEQTALVHGSQAAGHWPLIPVHPWQWTHYIQIQYAQALAHGWIRDLGQHGYWYQPQQSLRTLSNISIPEYCDVKLALTVLNTSSYRGIPARPIAIGPELSQWLWRQSQSDTELVDAGLEVQRELAGSHIPHPQHSQVAGGAYRYHEMLGAVWRESLPGKTGCGEHSMLLAALMQCDGADHPLIATLIRHSGLSPKVWLTHFFDRVTVPLYHLLCTYGIGLVAHGQNLGFILKSAIPERLVIKDFHGDLRCVDEPIPEQAGMPQHLLAELTRLPAAYLIHDLITGHFVTTLRFISPLLPDAGLLPEASFYSLLAERIRAYQRRHPELSERFELFPLLTPTFERVCINRVRFRIGYEDHADRPRPELGKPLSNPLLTGETP
ncbi:IucA/IucC family protein [Salicola sp. Rm-C-2C1-2]|uniref:IucA/IucC family protein n=1 Tax=Salicola sp. Rm-C-2C1-2 TaxID=3141321 RepID=UPI0032E3CB29